MKKDSKQIKFIILCCLVYFTSYITRKNYEAALAAIIDATNVSRAFAVIAVTGSLLTYGAGQLLSGYIGDKIQPKTLILLGLSATTVLNFCVGLEENMTVVVVMWCINGFAQAMLWPPLVKLLADKLPDKTFRSATTWVSVASSIATVAIYFIVPLCVNLSGWRMVFHVCGTVGMIVSIVWAISSKEMVIEDLSVFKKKKEKSDNSLLSIVKSSGILIVLVVIILQGALRDGITTWMPSYIRDTFEIPTTSAILTTVILPVFSIISFLVSGFLREKNKTEIHTASWLWGICTLCCGILLFTFNKNMMISVIMMAFMTACAHGINLMLIGYLPARFDKYGKVSFFSGLLNACTYIGSATSTYGIAVLSDGAGWGVTIAIWLGLAALGLILNTVSLKTTKNLLG